ncbi:MAG: triose-phosphate isomerase [Planctomycetaceae bacterium]|nr:triose-phosphate isomerase [Planctomycetaceae bacterium]
MRRLFVAGNWKMNTTAAVGSALASAIAAEVAQSQPAVDVAVCPPSPYLSTIKAALGSSPVLLGAQNAYFAAPGAFTGEVGLDMLADVGCQCVILGHSERRAIFGESDELINKKVAATLQKNLGVILCIGELLADRQGNKTEAVLETQLTGGLAGIDTAAMKNIVLAYEPVWAIGTGVTATPQQAQDTHKFIRNWLTKRYNAEVAAATRIQYGGSVTPETAAELLSQPDVDGALVGGASLKADKFIPIIKAAAAVKKSA